MQLGVAIGVAALAIAARGASAPAALALTPNLADRIERPLRYRPDGGDFVIVNGGEFFNRPLYGGNTAFRVDAGDRPEFSLYLPGRGGNFRLGWRGARGTKWLADAAEITARYRPGMMRYEVRDPDLSAGAMLQLDAVALAVTEGLLLRVEWRAGNGTGAAETPIELVWAYGGTNGQRGVRDGDIGTERVPIGEYFQLRPEYCRDNAFALAGNVFTLRSPPATLVGTMPVGAQLAVADAAQWASWDRLLASSTETPPPALPVVIGRVTLSSAQPVYLAVQRVAGGQGASAKRSATPAVLLPPFAVADLPRVWAETERHFQALRERVTLMTPDPFIDAAVAALNVAADAVWDEAQGAVMHGAIAWRTKLLGWRGPYAPDALGWHDRARRHFAYWATRQNLTPIPEKLPPPDENANLARSEAALHSNGDLSNSHYDMNLVYIDALFRHLAWTGDHAFAREVWPVIERHLAWERRLFRREFGPERDPLYEAYAAIWASDDLQYHGGGVTHASAYNADHHRQAARLARLFGHDAASYEREAADIARAMRRHLWLPERGMFAEFKDLLGAQRVHPAAALWTFYHTLDAGVPTPQEAWQMTQYVDTQIPHLPVRGPGVPTDEDYHVLSTTNWMPYTWSLNNVVMGENLHTALGYWQAGRPDEACRLAKGALLASMFMGICPGNVGSMNYLDVYRRESQRDFADGGGVLARALIEGLFGVQPDLLAGELLVRPGFPAKWDRATLRHPDVGVAFRRSGASETFAVESRFGRPLTLRLHMATRSETAMVTVNGRRAEWRWLDRTALRPCIEVTCPLETRAEIAVTWAGPELRVAAVPPARGQGSKPEPTLAAVDWRRKLPPGTRADPVDLSPHFNDRVTQIFRHEYRSPRSPFVSLALPKQGIGAWAGHVNATAEIDDSGLRAVAGANHGRLALPNGVEFVTPGPGDTPNVIFVSQWDNFPRAVDVPLSGRARLLCLLMAGSTNPMQSRIDNGEVIVTYADGGTARLALENPTTWWPIDEDYFIDDFAFRRPEPLPPRVDLKTGAVRLLEFPAFKGQGRKIPGGAATVLALPLEPGRELRSLTVRALANEVVIGLLGATLVRD
ncbi:MAG: DUF4450 domain-containing protein [Opitutae bacterium]|nr:DUF4450 domain-containing protein [Opitutae bacterium]